MEDKCEASAVVSTLLDSVLGAAFYRCRRNPEIKEREVCERWDFQLYHVMNL